MISHESAVPCPAEPAPVGTRLLAAITLCNPLLLLSPMCLLYGIYRAVTSPSLFIGDSANTIFNFVAMAVYVLMVCVTSTLLARKRIIPDTVMLLLLQAMLFVSPFILIAHGVFLEGDLAVALGWGGMGCLLAQLWILRNRLPESYLSRPMMIGGAVVLAVNFAAPLIFRNGLDNAKNDNEIWGTVSAYAWNLILPALAAWLNFLPNRSAGALWSRGWFAFVVYGLWLAGTGIQLWTIAYVDDRSLQAHQFTVTAWVLAWTLLHRAQVFPVAFAERLMSAAPIIAVAVPIAGGLAGLSLNIAGALLLLNVALCLTSGRRSLACISLAAATCCMPNAWMQSLMASTDRQEFVTIIVAAMILGGLAVLKDSRAGVVAAIGLATVLGKFTSLDGPTILNATILFLFVHQLRWSRITAAESCVLFLAGACWMITMAHSEMHGENIRSACMVATIVATLALRNASLGLPTSLVPPVCSIFVLLTHPANVSAHAATKAPSGGLAILMGFLLLAAGAWHSMRRAPSKIIPLEKA